MAENMGNVENMDNDERIYAIADDISQTIPVLYRWIIRPDATGISPYSPTIAVLKVIKNQGLLSMSAIAQALYYSKQNLTNIVDQLVADGYVERTADPADRRVLNIALTETGRAFLSRRKEIIKKRLVEDLSHLTEKELEHLSETFAEVKSALPKLLGDDTPDQFRGRSVPRPVVPYAKKQETE